MNQLREIANLPLVIPAFRAVANLEALSWAGLLVGMLFKYVLTSHVDLGETLVTVFGSIHGGLVIAYVALALLTALQRRWTLRIVALAILATIPPFATVLFDRWAYAGGRYGVGDEGGTRAA